MTEADARKAGQRANILGIGNAIHQEIHLHLNGSRPHLEFPAPREAGFRSRQADFHPDDKSAAILRSLIAQSTEWARQAQNADGGLPTDSAGTESCAWASAGLLWGVQAAGASPDTPWVRRVANWLTDQLNDDGGLPIVKRGDRSTTDSTAQFVTAILPHHTGDPRIERAIKWLIENQGADGSWPWEKLGSIGHTMSSSFALCALACALRRDHESQAIQYSVARGLNWLLDRQRMDGSWSLTNDALPSVSATGLASYALAHTIGTENQVEAAAESILQAHLASGHWTYEIDRPASHTVIRLANAYALLGLASSPSERHVKYAFQNLDNLTRMHNGESFYLAGTQTSSWPTRDGLLAASALLRYS